MSISRAPGIPVSIVCVYNDPDVLDSCLTRSIEVGASAAPATEFIPVDNRDGRFATAGAALNHGAREATRDVVVFVHQDVVLHSLTAIEQAARLLVDDPAIGLIGAVGIDHDRTVIGRMRDRVVQIGESAPTPRDVDSLDEVLFLVRRSQVIAHPLSEDPLLAWHAYGVEYACRVRRAGMRATAMDLRITHNSLTTNLDRLDVAHRKVGDDYPELLPIRTTCGSIYAGDGPWALSKLWRRARSATIWWGESLQVRAAQRVDPAPSTIADIRLVIDDAVARTGARGLCVIDVAGGDDRPVDGLRRFGRDYRIESRRVAEVRDRLRSAAPDEVTLVTGLQRSDFAALASRDFGPHVTGYWEDTGLWVLCGVDPATVAPLWPQRRNRPFAGLAGGGRGKAPR